MKTTLATLGAALAFGATASIAIAQGNPPTTVPPNPATAAGQQNPAGGPMGTTGTMPQNPGGSMGANSAPPSAATTSPQPAAPAAQPMRPARADRN
ncbi:Uncharacterised protein [Xylophilus ampelinus]|nr:proteophosphoglycan ppg4 [Variovorax sp.]VTY38828.1 Uncharacterised protein [Xylophilus ampelinus]